MMRSYLSKRLNLIKEKKVALLDENSSPLHRIMSVYNSDQENKFFTNNVAAFHVGNGVIMSVAHNLRIQDDLPELITNDYYNKEIVSKLTENQREKFNKVYQYLPNKGERSLQKTSQKERKELINLLNSKKINRNFNTLYDYNCCKPFLILNYRDNISENKGFNLNHAFYESELNRHTLILELKLITNLNNEDVAFYKIINTNENFIKGLPKIDIDFNIYDNKKIDFYFLQPGPFDHLGRIINNAKIEGFCDTSSFENDLLGNHYHMEGFRYLIDTFFRFGSSGSPYVVFNNKSKSFMANAIQSQASYIQLEINGEKKDNRQYKKAIATPLKNIELEFYDILNS